MTEQQQAPDTSRADYSRYAALLINYLRETEMDDKGMVGDLLILDITRDLGDAQGFQYVPKHLVHFFSEEYQVKVKTWAGEDQSFPDVPELDESAAPEFPDIDLGPAPGAEAAPAPEVPAEEEEAEAADA